MAASDDQALAKEPTADVTEYPRKKRRTAVGESSVDAVDGDNKAAKRSRKDRCHDGADGADDAADSLVTATASMPVDDAGEFKLTRDELRRMKKREKLMQKINKNQNPLGVDLSLNRAGFKQMITLGNVREFVLWCLADGTNPGWMMVKNRAAITSLVVLMVPHLDARPLLINPSNVSNEPIAVADYLRRAEKLGSSGRHLTVLQEMCSEVVPTRGPGDKTRVHSPVATLLTAPCKRSGNDSNEAGPKSTTATLEECLLPMRDMIQDEFTLPVENGEEDADQHQELAEGWVQALPRSADEASPAAEDDVYAIDCEMCITEQGYELTRASVVNFKGELVYDTLVKPATPIVDYLTQYSGITEIRLAGVKTTLRDVQTRILDFVRRETILVGHSLQNDLRALKLAHGRVIDTSVLFHHTRGRPYKPGLKWLAQRYLSRHIQMDPIPGKVEPGIERGRSSLGHDSYEDAKATIDLLRLVLLNGIGFGHTAVDTESVFARLDRQQPPVAAVMLDSPGIMRAYGSDAATTGVAMVASHDDASVMQGVERSVGRYRFVYGRLRAMEAVLDRRHRVGAVKGEMATGAAGEATQSPPASPPASPMDVDAAAKELNATLATLWASLPANTMLVVVSGQGDTRRAVELQLRYKRYRELLKTTPMSKIAAPDVFGEDEEMEMGREVVRARIGVTLFCVKQ